MMVNKLFSTFIIVTTLAVLPAKVMAQSSVYLDPSDKLTIHSPAPFSAFSSPLTVELEVEDNEQTSVTYNLVLYSGTSCSGDTTLNEVGEVDANSGIQSISVAVPALLKTACLEVCVGLQADETLYPVCNQRVLGENADGTTTNTSPVQPSKGEFSLPAIGSILNGEFNRVRWSFDQTPSSEVSLSYRLVGAGQPAKLIAAFPTTTRSFIWDVSTLTNGQYYLEITTQIDGVAEIIKSPVFLIDNPGRAVETAKPLVVVSSPLSNSTITSQRPTIAGSFITASGDRPLPDSFMLEINGEDRTNICQVNTTGFVCEGGPSLIAGLHKIRASYRTSSQLVASAEWSFTVNPTPGSRTDFSGFNLADVNWLLVGVISIVIFLLLFLPWFVWTRWRQRKTTTELYTTDDYETQVTEIRETKPVESRESTPTHTDAVVSDAGYIDPGAYTSYEDYLKAVSQKLADSEKTYVVSSPNPDREVITVSDANDQNIISVPDYEEGYKNKDSKSDNEGDTKKADDESKSGDNTPEWLRS